MLHQAGCTEDDLGSGDAPIAMVQTANARHGNHVPIAWPLLGTRDWGVALDRQMGTNGVIILEVGGHEPTEMGFVEHDHLIEELTA